MFCDDKIIIFLFDVYILSAYVTCMTHTVQCTVICFFSLSLSLSLSLSIYLSLYISLSFGIVTLCSSCYIYVEIYTLLCLHTCTCS